MQDFDSKSTESVPQASQQTKLESVRQTNDRHPSFIVGIGASAGGLEAIEQFFGSMPPDSGLAFIVVQHLSPDFKSMMDELLARHTEMPIRVIENEMQVEADSIYLIPPKKNMVIAQGKLLLTDQDPGQGLNLPIDILFRSLAQDIGERAVGVILSGTGSDGSRGIRDIHEAGGLVIAQDEETAKFDGMPRSAVATGVVDVELPPHAMPEALLEFVRHPVLSQQEAGPVTDEPSLSEVFSLLRARYGIDFTNYRPSTIGRRIERRMTICRASNLREYIQYLQDEPAGLDSLYADLLIGVTEFFRDKEAFDLISQRAIPQLFENLSPDNTIRVWVPGCATGEEAYSLAILLDEESRRRGRLVDIKIFATDVHQDSLARASAGIFPETCMANLSADRLQKYFTRKNNRFYVTHELRQLVIFAPHNLVKDPPFTKIDFISCRNLLIYLQPQTQRKVLSFFHFALRTGGTLLLGPSETTGDLSDEFDTIDSRWKLYSKRRDVRLPEVAKLPLAMNTPVRGGPAVAVRPDTTMRRVFESVLAKVAPPGMLLNEHRELVHVFGDAGRYLKVPGGEATVDVLRMVDGELRLAISSASHRALKTGETVVYRGVAVETNSGPENLRATFEPIHDAKANMDFVLVTFEESKAHAAPATFVETTEFDARGESIERIGQLERELLYTKEHLQSTIEELETSNEELQSTNEELVAANEELQSTNEELHSVNEELYTVNAEHQRKIQELTQLTDDMDNLLRSTEIGTVFVDLELKIRKFTPAIADAINLMPQDLGRPIEHISNNLSLAGSQLLSLVRKVVAAGNPIEQETKTRDGKSYLLRIFPYRTERREVEGAVLSLVDISSVKRVEAQLREADQRLNLALKSAGIGTWDWNVGEDVVVWDDFMHPLFGFDPGEFPGTYQAFLDVLHPDDREQTNHTVRAAIDTDAPFDTQYRVCWPDGELRVVQAKGKVYRDDRGQATRMTGVCWDVTDQVRAAQTRARLAAIVEASDDAIIGSSIDGTITSWNSAAERLYGYSANEAIDRPVKMIFPDNRQHELEEILDQLRRGEGIYRYRTERKRKNGSTVEVSLTISPIPNERGEIVGASAIARDITEVMDAERALREANERLRRTNEELQQFAYAASHDLREPLRTVRSFCELLTESYEGRLDDQADKWLQFMIEGTTRMQALIDDLLQYSRLETTAQPPARTDLNKVMATVLADMQASIEDASAEIQFDELPTIDVEPTQMGQLFQNLISNAIKYRRADPPRIRIAAKRRVGEWQFSVSDNGLGIKGEFREKVFELFKRLHPREKYGGTGIGLAICRKIALRHGGRIWVESEFGNGSTFYFTIPDQRLE